MIALSRLGLPLQGKKVSDVILAEETSSIDLIIGGHTHTFLDEPVQLSNKAGKDRMSHKDRMGWHSSQENRLLL